MTTIPPITIPAEPPMPKSLPTCPGDGICGNANSGGAGAGDGAGAGSVDWSLLQTLLQKLPDLLSEYGLLGIATSPRLTGPYAVRPRELINCFVLFVGLVALLNRRTQAGRIHSVHRVVPRVGIGLPGLIDQRIHAQELPRGRVVVAPNCSLLRRPGQELCNCERLVDRERTRTKQPRRPERMALPSSTRSAPWMPLTLQTNEYLTWMGVHNYAATTIENRRRYLGYFADFARDAGLTQPSEVTYEIVVDYQAALHAVSKGRRDSPIGGHPGPTSRARYPVLHLDAPRAPNQREPDVGPLDAPSRSPTTRGHPQQC